MSSSRRRVVVIIACVVVALAMAGLAARLSWWPFRPKLTEITDPAQAMVPVNLPSGLGDDFDSAALATALERSIEQLDLRASEPRVFGPDTVDARRVADGLREVLGWVRSGLQGEELIATIAKHQRCYESVAGDDGVLFTGYYEASLRGSRTQSDRYQTPLYRTPDDLIEVDLGLFSESLKGKHIYGRVQGGRLVPMPDRAEIAGGALAGRGLELIWVDDPIEAFFLEIQGSGRVQMDDGSTISIGYAGKNGREYKAIGSLLLQEGKIPREKMSADAIKTYLHEHPEEQRRILDFNPSVVFFKERSGPEGSSGAIVTGGRSIATETRLFPVGALALIRTVEPVIDSSGQRISEEPMVRLVLNQDTGGAIRGPGRVDVFTGFGPDAERLAGNLHDQGSLYFFAPLPPTEASR